MSVPVPESRAKVTGLSGTPFSKSSTTRAVSLAYLFPPTQVGLEVSRTAVGGPGVIVMVLLVAGAFPASSRAINTIGSVKV